MPSNTDAASSVFTAEELLSLIIKFAGWQSLRLWSQLDRRSRRLVHAECEARVVHVMQPFIPKEKVLDFFNLFRSDGDCKGGLVVGSVARRFFALRQGWYEGSRGRYNKRDDSRDLNLLVTMFQVNRLQELLHDYGYRDFASEEVHYPLKNHVTRVLRGWKTLGTNVSMSFNAMSESDSQ